MAGTGNPYLEEYAQQQHLYGSPVGVQPRKSRRMARLMRLKKMQEEQEQATATQAEFAEGFQAPAKELSPIEKRLTQYQETWQRYLKDAATLNRAPTEEEALAQQKMANPLMVQAELADEKARKEAWDEYWNAVDAGNPEAVDALLPINGQMWDAHRQERAQLEQSREYIKTLDPATQAPLIKQYRDALESSWKAHQEDEKRLEEYSKRLDAGIARRARAEIEQAKDIDSYSAKFKHLGGVSLAWAGKQLGRAQKMVAANLGNAVDVIKGDKGVLSALGDLALNTPAAPVGMFLDKTQERGELFNREVGQAAGSYVAEAERDDFAGQNYIRPIYNAPGAALIGASRLLSNAEEGYDIAKAKISGDPYIPEMTGRERREAWGAGTGQLAFEIVTDPLSYMDGVGSKAFKGIIKPIEPMLDAMSKRIGLKATAKALRWATVGGIPLEDPDMARYAIASKAAEVDKAAPIIREGYRAEAAIKAKWAEIPPELRPKAQEAAPRILEGVPAAERGGTVLRGVDLPVDYAEIPVYHGTARSFDTLDTGAKRVAILDKPGRGEPVRGIFFSPHKDVAENYVRYAIPRVMAEARAGRAAPGVWRGSTIAESYGKRGASADADWASATAERMFTEAEKRNPVAWRSTAAEGKLPFAGVALFSDVKVEGGRVFQFTRKNQAELEKSLLKIAQDPSLHDKAYIFTKTPSFDPRVIQTTLKGRVLDLTDARSWPKELVAAIQKSSNSEDQRIAKVLGNALKNDGKFQKLNTIERSPTLQNWIKDNGFDIVKKPEMDEITGDFSYWAVSEDALGGGTKYGPREVPSAAYEQALKDIPAQHRKSVVAYAQAIDDADVMLKKMTADTLGRNVELSDGILEGYLARRFSPETKLLLAEHPEIREALKDLAQAQHLHATGQEIPAANQFAKRKFSEGTTYHEAEKVLQEKFGKLFEGRAIWDRDQANVVLGDYLFAANAAKKQADVEEFTRIFGAADTAADDAIPAADFFKRFNAKMPEEFAGKFIPKARLKEFEGIRHIADPGKVRQILNRLTGWVSRSVLATPGSVSKDIKGQLINAAITDPQIFRHTEDAGRLILSGKMDDDLAELVAAGLERPSFDQIVSPSVIKATEEFGGGRLGKAAGIIEESGFTGGVIRGIEKVTGLGKLEKKLGSGIANLIDKAQFKVGNTRVMLPGAATARSLGEAGIGKTIGAIGRKSLNARQTSESIFRLATYKAAKARGLSRDEALREVAKWWGDFSQLSKLEANVLKGFVMFFSWQLRALKIGAAHFVDHPLRTRLFLALAAGNVSGDPSFPEWAQRQGGTIIGRDEFGNPKFISMGAGSYFEPLGDLLQGEAMQRLRTDGLRGVPRGLAQTALRRLAPLAQAPIEYMTNYDSFSGGQIYLEKGQDTARTRVSDHGPASLLWLPKSLRDMLGVREVVRKDDGEFSYVHVDPEWNWLFNKVAPGVGAELATVNPLADPRKDAWEAAARALGFPTYSVREQDVQKQVANKVRILTDAMRREIGGTGLAINDAGSVYFDQTSTVGREMAADNERWRREATEGKYNVDAYLRWKMGAKYPEALRFIDLGAYLNGWRKGIDAEREALKAPEADNLKAIRGLAAREAAKEQRRVLRGAPR